jgi:hypothetical protein
VLGILEVIQSDFARLEAETTAAESQAEREHNSFMTTTKTSLAEAKTSTEHTTSAKANNEQQLQAAHEDLEGKELILSEILVQCCISNNCKQRAQLKWN